MSIACDAGEERGDLTDLPKRLLVELHSRRDRRRPFRGELLNGL
jgi:hypothetical protein